MRITRSKADFASHSRSHARFFSGSPIHVARVPCTQLPAITCGSDVGLMPRARHSDSVGQFEQGMAGQTRVQGTQEVIAVERIMFPRILAIESNHDGVIGRICIPVRQLGDFIDQVIGRIVTMPGCVGEADEIRQCIIAKKKCSSRCRATDRAG